MDLQSWVYILATKRNGTLYTGVTTDLLRRVWEHREGVLPGFTKTYGVKVLVWYELHGDVLEAIAREKAIKRWRREWKLALIEAENPRWLDLYETLNGGPVELAPTSFVIPGETERSPKFRHPGRNGA